MAEVRLEVDVAHPPARVWRALTDARILGEWFMSTDLEPREGETFTLDPGGLAGFLGPVSGELTELAPPRRMVMLWQGEKLHTRVVWELAEIVGGGCRIRVVQSGFIGAPATLRRRALRATYTTVFAERLPPVLERLAASEADLGDQTIASLRTAVPRQRRGSTEGVPARSAAWYGSAGSTARGRPTAAKAASALTATTGSLAAVAAADAARAPGRVATAAPTEPVAGQLPESDLPGPEQPGPEQPGPEQLGPEQLGPEQLGPEQLGPERPGPDPAAGAEPEPPGRGVASVLGAWRGRLAVLPAWGRALAIGGAAAVLAVVVLAAVAQPSLSDLDGGPAVAPEEGRIGPGTGVQPGAGSSPAEDGDPTDATDGAGVAPGDPDATGGANGEEESGARPASPEPATGGGADHPEATPGETQVPESEPGDPPRPELTAEVTTSGRLLGLSGRSVSVTVSNQGPADAEIWEVTMDVGDQEVTNVSGAEYTRDGPVATFTAGGELAAGDTTTFSFDIPGSLLGIGGATDPTDCTIDGDPC